MSIPADSDKVKTVSALLDALRPHVQISSKQTAVLRVFSDEWEKAPVLTDKALLQLYKDMRVCRIVSVLATIQDMPLCRKGTAAACIVQADRKSVV